MRPRLRRVAIALRFFLMLCVVSVVWALARMYWPPREVMGSPPRRHAVQRNDLDLSREGEWLAKFGKAFRPSGWFDPGPALIFSPIVHYFAGWDVYGDQLCLEGTVRYISVAADDGDIGIHLRLPPFYAHYSWRPNHPEDGLGHDDMVVEIDYPIRHLYPVVYDIAPGDTVRVCGRWVFDRGHDHMEIHPARWVEIVREAP